MSARFARAALLLCAATAASFTAVFSMAQEAVTYESSFDETGDGEALMSGVSFRDAACGEECHTANLHCGATQDISFVFADIEAEIAAAAITSEKKEFAIAAGGASHAFSIRKVEYGGEMYNTWDVEGELSGDAAEFAAALGKAKEFKVSLGTRSVTLPVTEDVVKWAKACVK